MSPLLIFDLRHDWMNFNAVKAFFTERQTTVNLKFYKGFSEMYPLLNQVYGSLLTVKDEFWARVVVWISALTVIASVASAKRGDPDRKENLSLSSTGLLRHAFHAILPPEAGRHSDVVNNNHA